MSQWQLDHLFDLRQLLSATADVIVADLCEALLLFGTFDWLAFGVDDRVRSDDAVRRRVGLDHFELDRSHTATHQKQIALVHRSVGLGEVRLEVDVEQTAGQTCGGG